MRKLVRESRVSYPERSSVLPENWALAYPELSKFEAYSGFVTQGENGGFVHQEVQDFCKLDQPGLLLSRELADRLTNDDQFLVESIDFQAMTEWAEGREDSLHGVEFGVLRLGTTNGSETELEVALKPFHTWRRGAANELAAMLKTPELTTIRSFEPLGMINNGRKIALLTRFETEVLSLDNIEWQRGIYQPFQETFDVMEALQKSALTLAHMHQAGVVHNDAQIKNMAVVSNDVLTEVRLIDLEGAKWRDVSDYQQRQKFLDGVYSDGSALVESILKRGLWNDAGYSDKARAIQVLFAEPYLSFLRHPANRDSLYTNELHQEVEDRILAVLEGI